MPIATAFLQLTFFLAALTAGRWQQAAPSAAPEFNLIHRDNLAGTQNLTQEELVTRMLTRDKIHMERALSAAHQGQKSQYSVSGEFLATILAGTPPQRVSLIMDTTSEITWMKCAFNNGTLIKMKSAVFNNYNSTSYISMTCNNPPMKCRQDVQAVLNNTQLGCRSSGDCFYNASYRDVAISSDIAKETFTIYLNTSRKTHVTVRFGATQFTSNLDSVLVPNLYGVLALGPGPISFASQVSHGEFSYCLGQYLNGSGRLIFGPAPISKPQCTYVVTTGVNHTLYEVKVKAIRIDKTELRKGISNGTWIVDLGQSFTSLPDGMYEKVVNTLNRRMLGHGYQNITGSKYKGLDHCYTKPSGIKGLALPQLGIVFDKGVVFESVGPGLVVESGNGVICLSIIKNYVYPFYAVIGNLLQRDNWLQFGENKLCFAKAVNCT